MIQSSDLLTLGAEQVRAVSEFGSPPLLLGRGIVMSIYDREFPSAFVLLSELARLKVKLPIEVFYRSGELSDEHTRIIEDFHRAFKLDIQLQCLKEADLPGFAVKPFAVYESRFREVLWLDADCFPTRNPVFLFDDPEYQQKGSLFWRDVSGADRSRFWHPESPVWPVFGVPYNDAEEFDTGIFLIDKSKCWAELGLTLYFNRRHDTYYRFVHGDKDTFRLAWQHLDVKQRQVIQQTNYLTGDVPYGFMPFGPFHVGAPNPWRKWGGGSVMVQRDRFGKPLANHWTVDKPRSGEKSGPWETYGPPEGRYYDSHLAELERIYRAS